MEQAKCLDNNTWEKREPQHKIIHGHNNHDHHFPTTKIMKRFNQQSPISSSWEDYQEDEALSDSAILGGQGGSLTWPPRSYSCSFCKREFRSAQALGGHMNVHRRDRALLKQVSINSNPHDDDFDYHNNHDHHVINTCSKSKPLDQIPSQVCSPKITNYNNNVVAHAHHHPLSRVSTNSVLSSGISKVITTINEGFDQDHPKMSMGLDLAMGAYLKDEDTYHQEDFPKYNKRIKKGSNDDYNYNNNVALFQFLDDEIKCSDLKDDEGLKVQEVMNVRASKSMEELDLELRLGKPHQKIK